MRAKVSPGERTTAQRIATTDRKVPRFLFDVTGSLSFPAGPFRLSGQTAACLRPHSFVLWSASFYVSHSRSTGSSWHLTEIAGAGIPGVRSPCFKSVRSVIGKWGRCLLLVFTVASSDISDDYVCVTMQTLILCTRSVAEESGRAKLTSSPARKLAGVAISDSSLLVGESRSSSKTRNWGITP
jgi:hypothetical protein